MRPEQELNDPPRVALAECVAAGEGRCVEQVLEQFPEVAHDDEHLLELIYLEYVLRQELGQEIPPEVWSARFPALHERLMRLWEVDGAFQSVAAAPAAEFSDAGAETYLGAEPATVPLLHRMGEYHCVEVIGRGGMGVVYRAIQHRLGRVVALKTIDAVRGVADSQVVARLLQEARLCAKLQHENIVQVYESGLHDGIPYFSMELVPGGTLQDVFAEGPLQPQIAAQLVTILAQAVAYAHAQAVLHRDIKPANVLLAPCQTGSGVQLRPDAGPVQPKLTDFGLAKCLTLPSLHTHTGVPIGTPSYIAPEQVTDGARSDHRADIYGLGAILYHALAGRPPYHLPTVLETLYSVCNDDPVALRTLVAKLPSDLETICSKCLSKDPRRRYESAAELVHDLDCFRNGLPITARPIRWWERSIKWAKRRPAQAVAVGAVVLVAISTSTLWYRAERHRNVAEAAVADARVASTQTLAALRTLTQDIVFDKLARQDKLSEADRAFLDRISEMYDELAELPHQSEDHRLIRAEGLYYSGLFQRQLADFPAAFDFFARTVAIYEDVYHEHPTEEVFFRLLDALEQFVSVAEEINRLDKAMEMSRRRIDLSRSVSLHLAEAGESRRVYALGKAHQQFANIYLLKNDYGEARRWLVQGEAALRQHLKTYSDDACRLVLANTLRTLSFTSSDVTEQLSYTEQSIEILRKLVQHAPGKTDYVYSLCWAVYDHTFALEKNGDLQQAADCLAEPISMVENETKTRPILTEGYQVLAYLTGRRGQLYIVLEQYDAAHRDYQRSLELARMLLEQAPMSFDLHKRYVRSAVGVAQVLTAERKDAEARVAIGHAYEAIRIMREVIDDLHEKETKVQESEAILVALEAVLGPAQQ